MYKRPMRRVAFLLLINFVPGFFCANAQTIAQSSNEKPTFASRTAGLQKHDGFLAYY
jgi:hypothetical protein